MTQPRFKPTPPGLAMSSSPNFLASAFFVEQIQKEINECMEYKDYPEAIKKINEALLLPCGEPTVIILLLEAYGVCRRNLTSKESAAETGHSLSREANAKKEFIERYQSEFKLPEDRDSQITAEYAWLADKYSHDKNSMEALRFAWLTLQYNDQDEKRRECFFERVTALKETEQNYNYVSVALQGTKLLLNQPTPKPSYSIWHSRLLLWLNHPAHECMECLTQLIERDFTQEFKEFRSEIYMRSGQLELINVKNQTSDVYSIKSPNVKAYKGRALALEAIYHEKPSSELKMLVQQDLTIAIWLEYAEKNNILKQKTIKEPTSKRLKNLYLSIAAGHQARIEAFLEDNLIDRAFSEYSHLQKLVSEFVQQYPKELPPYCAQNFLSLLAAKCDAFINQNKLGNARLCNNKMLALKSDDESAQKIKVQLDALKEAEQRQAATRIDGLLSEIKKSEMRKSDLINHAESASAHGVSTTASSTVNSMAEQKLQAAVEEMIDDNVVFHADDSTSDEAKKPEMAKKALEIFNHFIGERYEQTRNAAEPVLQDFTNNRRVNECYIRATIEVSQRTEDAKSILQDKPHHEKSLHILTRLIQSDPQPKYYLWQAQLFNLLNQQEGAIKAIKRLIKIDLQNPFDGAMKQQLFFVARDVEKWGDKTSLFTLSKEDQYAYAIKIRARGQRYAKSENFLLARHYFIFALWMQNYFKEQCNYDVIRHERLDANSPLFKIYPQIIGLYEDLRLIYEKHDQMDLVASSRHQGEQMKARFDAMKKGIPFLGSTPKPLKVKEAKANEQALLAELEKEDESQAQAIKKRKKNAKKQAQKKAKKLLSSVQEATTEKPDTENAAQKKEDPKKEDLKKEDSKKDDPKKDDPKKDDPKKEVTQLAVKSKAVQADRKITIAEKPTQRTDSHSLLAPSQSNPVVRKSVAQTSHVPKAKSTTVATVKLPMAARISKSVSVQPKKPVKTPEKDSKGNSAVSSQRIAVAASSQSAPRSAWATPFIKSTKVAPPALTANAPAVTVSIVVSVATPSQTPTPSLVTVKVPDVKRTNTIRLASHECKTIRDLKLAGAEVYLRCDMIRLLTLDAKLYANKNRDYVLPYEHKAIVEKVFQSNLLLQKKDVPNLLCVTAHVENHFFQNQFHLSQKLNQTESGRLLEAESCELTIHTLTATTELLDTKAIQDDQAVADNKLMDEEVTVLDPTGKGLSDLFEGRLRYLNEPALLFQQDVGNIVRIIAHLVAENRKMEGFKASHPFVPTFFLDEKIKKAIIEFKLDVKTMSDEQRDDINGLMTQLLVGSNAFHGFQAMLDERVFDLFFPEMAEVLRKKPDSRQRIAGKLKSTPPRSLDEAYKLFFMSSYYELRKEQSHLVVLEKLLSNQLVKKIFAIQSLPHECDTIRQLKKEGASDVYLRGDIVPDRLLNLTEKANSSKNRHYVLPAEQKTIVQKVFQSNLLLQREEMPNTLSVTTRVANQFYQNQFHLSQKLNRTESGRLLEAEDCELTIHTLAATTDLLDEKANQSEQFTAARKLASEELTVLDPTGKGLSDLFEGRLRSLKEPALLFQQDVGHIVRVIVHLVAENRKSDSVKASNPLAPTFFLDEKIKKAIIEFKLDVKTMSDEQRDHINGLMTQLLVGSNACHGFQAMLDERVFDLFFPDMAEVLRKKLEIQQLIADKLKSTPPRSLDEAYKLFFIQTYHELRKEQAHPVVLEKLLSNQLIKNIFTIQLLPHEYNTIRKLKKAGASGVDLRDEVVRDRLLHLTASHESSKKRQYVVSSDSKIQVEKLFKSHLLPPTESNTLCVSEKISGTSHQSQFHLSDKLDGTAQGRLLETDTCDLTIYTLSVTTELLDEKVNHENKSQAVKKSVNEVATVFDPTGNGIPDLLEGRLRCVKDPGLLFKEDACLPLRILAGLVTENRKTERIRKYNLVAPKFFLDPAIQKAINEFKLDMTALRPEQRDQINGMMNTLFVGEHAHRYFQVMMEENVFDLFFPDIAIVLRNRPQLLKTIEEKLKNSPPRSLNEVYKLFFFKIYYELKSEQVPSILINQLLSNKLFHEIQKIYAIRLTWSERVLMNQFKRAGVAEINLVGDVVRDRMRRVEVKSESNSLQEFVLPKTHKNRIRQLFHDNQIQEESENFCIVNMSEKVAIKLHLSDKLDGTMKGAQQEAEDCLFTIDTLSATTQAIDEKVSQESKWAEEEVTVLDPTGFGILDLLEGRLRCLGVPALLFKKDIANIFRILSALMAENSKSERVKSSNPITFQFFLDEKIKDAITEFKIDMKTVSDEQRDYINHVLGRHLVGDNAYPFFQTMMNERVFDVFFPEMASALRDKRQLVLIEIQNLLKNLRPSSIKDVYKIFFLQIYHALKEEQDGLTVVENLLSNKLFHELEAEWQADPAAFAASFFQMNSAQPNPNYHQGHESPVSLGRSESSGSPMQFAHVREQANQSPSHRMPSPGFDTRSIPSPAYSASPRSNASPQSWQLENRQSPLPEQASFVGGQPPLFSSDLVALPALESKQQPAAFAYGDGRPMMPIPAYYPHAAMQPTAPHLMPPDLHPSQRQPFYGPSHYGMAGYPQQDRQRQAFQQNRQFSHAGSMPGNHQPRFFDNRGRPGDMPMSHGHRENPVWHHPNPMAHGHPRMQRPEGNHGSTGRGQARVGQHPRSQTPPPSLRSLQSAQPQLAAWQPPADLHTANPHPFSQPQKRKRHRTRQGDTSTFVRQQLASHSMSSSVSVDDSMVDAAPLQTSTSVNESQVAYQLYQQPTAAAVTVEQTVLMPSNKGAL